MMRYVTGAVGVVAAALFVGYSAVITYNVAHDMTTEFKQLAGYAAAGIVLWECLGLLFVRQCWQNGARWLAAGGLALVVAAAVYTARLDLRFHVAGQADMAASRDASVETRKMTREELAKARARRDTLQQTKRLTEAQEDELNAIGKRISELEGRFDTQIVNAGGMPEAGWASRMLSKVSDDEVWWQDALMVFGLVFWALARMVAMPLAVASMGTLRKPEEAAKAHEATVTPSAFLPAIPRPRKDALATIAGVDVRKDIGQTDGIAAEASDKPAPDHFRGVTKMVADVRVAEHSEKFAETNTAEINADNAQISAEELTPPDGPGTPANLPEIPDSSPADGDTEPTNVVPLRSDHPTKAEMKIRRRDQPELKDFVRERLTIDRDALAAMKATIRERRSLDKHVSERLMDSPDCYALYDDWCDENGLSRKSHKAFSGELWSFIGLPKGTRKLKGVKGIRNANGMRFPVISHDAEELVSTQKKVRAA